MKFDGFELRHYRLPYSRNVHWFRSQETEGEFVALRIFAGEARGVAEATIKPTWTGLSARAFAMLISDLLMPALKDVDLSDPLAVRRTLLMFPGNPVAKMVVQNACASLLACARGQPLWDMLGGTSTAQISWCVTRQSPAAMAAEAEAMVAKHGFRALKIKGGQGFGTDTTALRAIRAAVGDGVTLTVDANAAYTVAQAHDYIGLLEQEGVTVAEDPCPLLPDDTLRTIVNGAALPILVDMPCTSVEDARAFIDAGAGAISIKPGRIGVTEAALIAEMATLADVAVCSGMFAESSLGTTISLSYGTTLTSPLLPAEQSFFLMMQEQIMKDALKIKDGTVTLPADPDMDAAVDWSRTEVIAGMPPKQYGPT